MKRFFLIIAPSLIAAAVLRAQDGATPLPPSSANPNSAAAIASRQDAEQSYNQLKGQVDDLIAAEADRDKQIIELKRQLEELRQQPAKASGNYASQDEVKQLADALKEIDKKREADKELILKEMEKLGQTLSTPTPRGPSHPTRDDSTPVSNSDTSAHPAGDQNGFYYTIKSGDTIGLIAQAYREQGVKVSTKQILDANPNLNPAKLIVGKKVFIPAPKGSTLK